MVCVVASARRQDLSHTIDDKKKLLNRISRIRGQVESIQRDLDGERDCSEILHTVAACRGAMDGLMAELIEGHIQSHLNEPRAKRVLIDVVRAYLK